jgi:ABC-type Zn uptake system ZnuABC Zn-binding protein ZnuA
VGRVAGDRAQVETLVPVDADAHAYQPTAEDALRLSQANLLVTIGAGYEAFLQGLLENAGASVPLVEANTGVTILPLTGEHTHEEGEPHSEDEAHAAKEPLGILGASVECETHTEGESHSEDEHVHGDCDPHTWMNPLNIIIWVQNIADALAAADPANADAYRENAAAYSDELQALDAEIAAMVEALPAGSRRLLTNHENLQYFAARYGFEQVATVLPGGSSEAEIDPQALADLIRLVQEEGVPVLFVEITANTALAETLTRDAGIRLVSDLYIEAVSGAEGPAPSYLDLMRYNAGQIVGALAAS